MATVTGSKRHLDITSDTLTTSSNVDVGAKLFITTTDTNTTSTSALVLNSNEVEARTLGSNAFTSYTDHTTQGYATETWVGEQNYLTSVAFSDLSSTPTTISGYGITDAFDGNYSSLSGTPTLGTAAAADTTDFASSSHNHDSLYVSYESVTREVPSTGGWYKLLRISRGGARVAISYTGGSFTPQTYVVEAYKDWSTTGTLSAQSFGQAAWINGFRIIQETNSGPYYLEANFKSISQTHSFKCYYQELVGYDSITEVFAVSSGSTLPASNSSGNTAIETLNITDNQEGLYVRNLDVSSRLYLDLTDVNTTSTTALVLNGNEVEQRTLGSNAFTSYSDHTSAGYLTSVAFSDLTSTPTTISGYGITDAFDGAFSSLSGTPTTISGYGITDAFDGAYSSLTGVPSTFAPSAHNQAWSTITGTPTTVSGYGITDALTTVTWADLTGDQANVDISGFNNDANFITRNVAGDLTIGDGTATSRLLIKKSDNNTSDHIIFYNGTTRVGEIGCHDTTWLRINQSTAKNIYTPRYIRADAGFFVDGTTKGIDGSGNFIGGTITGASDANVSNWDTAYNWGDHGQEGYLTSIAANSIGITELDVTDGTSGQVLTTDGNGVLSFATVSSGGGTDTNYYLDGVSRTSGTNTLVFSVNGATNQSYTFGDNAFTSYSNHESAGYLRGSDDLEWSNVVNTPTTIAGYGITDAFDGAFSSLSGKPTTIGGYGITDAFDGAYASLSGIPSTFAPSAHTHTPTQAGLANLSNSGNSLAGTFTATGDIIAYSDVRVKENIQDIDNALDKVTQLRGVEYNKIGSGEKSIGVIAQEIQKILPEVVQEDQDGMLGVAYGNITAVLIEAIKEQQKQIDELKSIIDGFTK